jgi:alpha-tubulin suppressor-like RCC1 family protein
MHPEGTYNIANAYTYLALVRFGNSIWLCTASGGASAGESPTVAPSKWQLLVDGTAFGGTPNTLPYINGAGNIALLPLTAGMLKITGTTPAFVPQNTPTPAKRAASILMDTVGSAPALVFISNDDQIMTCGQQDTNGIYSRVEGTGAIPIAIALNGTKTGQWTKVYCNRYNIYGLTSTGEVWGMGAALGLGLGDSTNTSQRYRMLHKIPVPATVVELSIPSGSDVAGCVFARTDTGNAWCWGNNSIGQLGLGDLVNRVSPVQIASLTNILKISVGGIASHAHVLTMDTAGALRVWGYNAQGQLGLNDLVNRTAPTLVVGKTVTDINAMGVGAAAAAFGFSQIIVAGAIQTSGYNVQGAIGDNTIVNKSVFTATTLGHTTITKLVRANGCNAHAGYITSLKELWLGGGNVSGELGMGNTTQSNVFVKPTFAGQGKIVTAKIAGGGGTTAALVNILALDENGNVWVSGYDVHGQLGQGGATVTNLFRKIPLPEPIVDIEVTDTTALVIAAPAPYAHYALGASGRLYAWGGGTSGQLGSGMLFNALTPVEMLLQ